MDESYLQWLGFIPGLTAGKARKIAERFPTYELLRAATREELASVEGLSTPDVDVVFRLLRDAPGGAAPGNLFLCPECGSFVGPRAEACPSCGVQFELSVSSEFPDRLDDFHREESTPARICQTCGTAMGRDATECSVCGRRYGPIELAIHPGLETSLDDTSPFCSRCGAHLSSNESECAICGTPASAAPGALPPAGRKGIVKDLLSRWQRAARPEAAVSETDRLGEELDHYDRLLEADPTLERAWANRAKILQKLGRGKDAAKSLAKAAELNPDKEDRYWIEIQDILRTTADVPVLRPRRQQSTAAAPPKADKVRLLDPLAHYESLLQADPSLIVAWRRKAEIFERLGRLKEARACVERAERLESAGNRSLRAAVTGLQSNGLATPGPAGAGRTNGRVNGTRAGRTNGRVNGRTNGRVNGLTNGLRGRTNGLTNGLVNGLVSMRLGLTNGLTNGLGRTNGITNGLGRTNGLTNGLGGLRSAGFRATGIRGMMRTAGWKLYVIPLVVVGLLLMPVFFVPEYNGPASPIQIDGQFADWAAVPTEAMASGGVLNPNADVVRFGVVDNLGPFAFYVEVAGSALRGGGPSTRMMDTVRFFVDIDGSPTTGYHIDGLGADRMIEVSGYDGAVLSSILWEFDANRDKQDWNGWIKGTSTAAGSSGSRIEAQAEWLPSGPTAVPVIATVHTASWEGQTDASDFPVSPSAGTLSVVTDPLVPDVLSGSGVPLLRLTLTAHGQPVTVDSLQVQIAGTAAATSALSLRMMNGTTGLALTVPTSRDVMFSFTPIQLGIGATTTFSVVGDFTSASGETFGLRLPLTHPFGFGAGVVGLRENAGPRTLGYLGVVPSVPQVDGAFDEWTAASPDASSDVMPRANPDIDIGRYGALPSGISTYVYTDLAGRILRGTPIPEAPREAPTQTPPAAPDTDRDTVPDLSDPMPLDFNNDGTADAQTNGDYDGDGITDYGFIAGTDYWLNTTIPGSFPAPYAGRVITLFIGPTYKPSVSGEDVLRVFLDIDNSSSSGYAIGGIGADRLVEIRGKDNQVTQTALLAFSGSFPGQWAWTPVSPVTFALGYHAVELSVSLNATSVYVEAGDFWGSVDTTTTVSAGAPQTSPFQVAPSSIATESSPPVEVMDISGNQQWFFRDTTTTGAGCTTNRAASTTAGAAATSTALSGTSSICWFTPLDPPDTITGTWEFILDIDKTTDGTQTLLPNALGDTNAWTTFGCTEANEYECVDEDPNDGDTTYITSSASTVTDSLFNIQDWASAPSPLSIVNVVVEASCRKTTNPAVAVNILVKSGATLSVGATSQNCANSATYTVWSDTWTTDPADGLAWTLTGINALQIGVRDNDATTRVVRASHVKATVTFAPVYSVAIDKCTAEDCSTFTTLYGPTNSNTFGSDVTFTTGSIGGQTLGPTERIRFRVKLEAGGSVTVRYNGPNPGTDDSRATVPIPEFEQIVTALVAVFVVIPIRRRLMRRRGDRRAIESAHAGRAELGNDDPSDQSAAGR